MSFIIVDLSRDIFTQRNIFLGIAKLWGFCDLALWLCGRIRSRWCETECLGESFPTHQRTLDFVERIKSYDHLKLVV
jgi:hypothetical protein